MRIIDNHFSVPVGKTDLLKPPKHFPVAVLRYTLCEMTLVWHMYGGYDFKSSQKEEEIEKLGKKKTVNFSDNNLNNERLAGGVTYSTKMPGEVNFKSLPNKKLQNMTWQTKGGVAREHGVLMELQLNKVHIFTFSSFYFISSVFIFGYYYYLCVDVCVVGLEYFIYWFIAGEIST